jgi:penicillin-binding protein A
VNASITRLANALFLGFLVIAGALGWWQVVQADALQARSNNPRTVEEEARIVRGRILDRNGAVLAENAANAPGGARQYSLPALVHVVGYHSPRFGSAGIEDTFDAFLRGARSGSLLARLGDQLVHRAPVGADLRLTLDADLSRVAAEALGRSAGAIVALDPRSGEVLAMVSAPYFDASQLAERWEALRDDDSAPLVPRATEGLYTPGSVFKLVTAGAALDLNAVQVDAAHDCTTDLIVNGFRVEQKNHPQLRRVTFAQDFAWSDNVTFAKTGLGLGTGYPIDFDDAAPQPYPWERDGIAGSLQRFLEYAHRFGFGERIPFDLPVAASQISGHEQRMTAVELASTAFGQGELEATPLLMALVAATAANGGAMPAPYLVSEIRGADGSVQRPHLPGGRLRQVVRPETAATLTRLMVLSVDEAYARAAQIPGVKVGGKTGTAEVGPGRTPHSWFVGFAPADNPRIAIAAIMENRGSGSDVATPAARQVIAAALARPTAGSGPRDASWSADWPSSDLAASGAALPLAAEGSAAPLTARGSSAPFAAGESTARLATRDGAAPLAAAPSGAYCLLPPRG